MLPFGDAKHVEQLNRNRLPIGHQAQQPRRGL